MVTSTGSVPEPTLRRGSRRPRTEWLWLALWLPVAAAIVLPTVHSFTQLSHIDEFQHVDYLVKTQRLKHVNGGERVGQVAMREQACRGIDLRGVVLPPCSQRHLHPEEFPGAGFNHTYADPPTYYLLTAPVAAAVQRAPFVDSVVTAGRSVGVLWLAGGLAVTFALAVRLGASRRAAAGATLLLGSAPAVVLSTSTVTSDAPELLVGGLLFLAAVGVAEGRRAWWWLPLAAALGTAFKVTSLTAVGAVAIFLVWCWVAERREQRQPDGPTAAADESPPTRSSRGLLLAVAGMLVAASAPLLAWGAYSSATALPNADDIPMGQEFRVSGLSWAALADSVPRLFSPVRRPDAPPFVMGDTVTLLVHVTNLLLISACVGLAWFGVRRALSTRLAAAVTAAMALSGPAYLVLLYATLQVSYWVPGRYGLSLLPAAAAVLAVAAGRRRAGEIALLALGSFALMALLVETI